MDSNKKHTTAQIKNHLSDQFKNASVSPSKKCPTAISYTGLIKIFQKKKVNEKNRKNDFKKDFS
jgi:hypothetical protein